MSKPLTILDLSESCRNFHDADTAAKHLASEILSVEDKQLMIDRRKQSQHWADMNDAIEHEHSLAAAMIYFETIIAMTHWLEHTLMHVMVDGRGAEFERYRKAYEKDLGWKVSVSPGTEQMITDGLDVMNNGHIVRATPDFEQMKEDTFDE